MLKHQEISIHLIRRTEYRRTIRAAITNQPTIFHRCTKPLTILAKRLSVHPKHLQPDPLLAPSTSTRTIFELSPRSILRPEPERRAENVHLYLRYLTKDVEESWRGGLRGGWCVGKGGEGVGWEGDGEEGM